MGDPPADQPTQRVLYEREGHFDDVGALCIWARLRADTE
mgnify:CR=1 FL=1